MNATNQHSNELSAKRIALQNTFKVHTQANGFSYEEWINPPAGSFYEGYKKELDEINDEMAPPLTYQS
ncbi:conserved hypothetical protein [Abyssogena phaseoliformis symbiont OG214]|uniref:hypothetical protein n=1 Tax=Abyssogena phaseoliformis symbiont TaxID=596095 RepID=UPI0019151E63|nr:hypothetical protein [Abyssogena phaseoliformis symbiont]MBW5289138.1 hypothetical protein [Candidatus Ruthia sp. Apha_13_S6]BBB22526.1 conserved hypothetical protein [Abyssogena phaseoliformis symbiont OG214]